MNTLINFTKKIVGLNLLFLFQILQAQAQVTSDFTSSNDGWTVFDANAGSSSAATYNASGGNPGGYVSFTTSSGITNE